MSSINSQSSWLEFVVLICIFMDFSPKESVSSSTVTVCRDMLPFTGPHKLLPNNAVKWTLKQLDSQSNLKCVKVIKFNLLQCADKNLLMCEIWKRNFRVV